MIRSPPPSWWRVASRPPTWSARRWGAAALGALLTAVLIGVPSDVIPNPVFGRPVDVTWWSYPSLVLAALLGGLLAATYVRTGERDQVDRPGKLGTAGGFLAYLAVGCPVCNKLVLLARKLHCPVMTNDYNLNRVAEIQGVQVLNINELTNAVKAIYLPGETFEVHILQEGREVGQGVGYLEDGTMVVIQDGLRYLGQERTVEVTRAIQTAAGRMIFARPV